MKKISDRYNVLIIDTDMGGRMRLKQATSSVPTFDKAYFAANLKDGLNHLTTGEEVDVIFFTDNFQLKDLTAFVTEAKTTPVGSMCCYILVQKKKTTAAGSARQLLGGVDGLLEEPYSIESLVQVTEITSNLREKLAIVARRNAMKTLLKDIIAQLTAIGQFQSMGVEPNRLKQKLRETCDILKTADAQTIEIYLDLAVQMFDRVPIPTPLKNAFMYKGKSARVKRKIEEMMVRDYKKEGPEISDD